MRFSALPGALSSTLRPLTCNDPEFMVNFCSELRDGVTGPATPEH